MPEEVTTGSESSDQLAAFSNLTRGAGEIMVIRTIQRFIEPIFVPIFRPLIRQIVEERIGLTNPELLASLNENPQNNMIGTSVPKRLKLKFINKISLPVYTGIPLLGENTKLIEIALVDALTEQIVNTGTESCAKLEIMGFQVHDDDDGGSTFEEFRERMLSERTGKRILQGNTRLQLKEGVGFVHDVHFTHDSQHTKNGLYRLGAIVVDPALMKHVEAACTETFVVKDKRSIYYEKHVNPLLSDKVCHLQQIRYKGTRYKNLQHEKVETVRDLLILLYTDPTRLEKILDLKASSKIWTHIVKNAQASNGMFLYLDPRKTGVVLDARRQLKALILDPHLYIPVDHMSDQQKAEAQTLVKFASEHLQALDYFEDEISLQKHLQSGPGFTSLPEEPPSTFSGYPSTLTSPNGLNFFYATSSQAPEPYDTCGLVNTYDTSSSRKWEEPEFDDIMNYLSTILYESPNIECRSSVSVCSVAGTRWRNVSKLLRRNSVRERISLLTEIQPLKKQKCC